MTTAAIVADIERETATEVERLLLEADATASGIVGAARTELRAAIEAATARAEPAARLAGALRVNATRLRLIEEYSAAAVAVVDSVFEAAAARLAAIADGAEPERWAAAVRRLAEEGLRLTGRGARLSVRPADARSLAALARTYEALIETYAAAGAGVVAISADTRLELDATVATRLDRARSRLADAVARRVAEPAAHD